MKVCASWSRVRGKPGEEVKGWMGTAFLSSFPDCSVSRVRARLCLLARQPSRQRCPRRTLAGAPRAGTSGRLRGQRCAGRTLPHLLPAVSRLPSRPWQGQTLGCSPSPDKLPAMRTNGQQRLLSLHKTRPGLSRAPCTCSQRHRHAMGTGRARGGCLPQDISGAPHGHVP